MKAFSPSWISSSKAGKQRKYRAKAPLHIKKKFLASHLSKPLREKHKKRSATIRKGDTVKVMRGQFRGKTGKIERIDLSRQKIYVAGVEGKKADGTKTFQGINPSNLMITELVLEDKRRFK